MIRQDSTHPTGVSSDNPDRKANGQNLAKARVRKVDSALALALGNATWDEIARICGYPSAATAKRAVETALAKQLRETDKEQLRIMAGARLNQLLRSVWAKAVDPGHPEQMVALTKARELIDRHCKLFGLDAPAEVVVHNPTSKEIEQLVASIVSGTMPEVEQYDILQADEQEDGSYAVSNSA